MSNPHEPLLPTESPSPSRLKLWLLLGGAGVALASIAVIVFLRPSSPATTVDEPSPPERPAATPRSQADSSSRPKPIDPEEKAAQELYSSAEAYETSHPGDRDQVPARYLKVFQAHPTTMWGRKADQKYRRLQDSLQASHDQEFRAAAKDAQTLAAAGHFVDAIDAMRTYLKEQTLESLRRRAEREIVSIENASRGAFNALAQRTAAMAKNGEYSQAAALFEILKADAIPEVARRCDGSIGELRETARTAETSAAAEKVEEAHKAFREGAAPKILALLRARRYEEGLKEFDAAAADPAVAPIQADLARERASIADAAAFWEAFVKALRARMNQDVSMTVVGAKEVRAAGKLVRLDGDRAALEGTDGTAEVIFSQIHLDQIVGWTIGKTLAADDASTCIKAAHFFFFEGRDDLARLYLATAKEMGGDIVNAERVFREGFLRAARK
jgi:hypothetical protein